MRITAYDLAQRFVGLKEAPGAASNAHVLAMLRLDAGWPDGDDVPWCSAFVNYVAWLLRLPRSKSLRARSWLGVGTPVPLEFAKPGFDVVILSRSTGSPAPPADDRTAPGHVGFFAGVEPAEPFAPSTAAVLVLGGNQGDAVTIARYPRARVLGVRRLAEDAGD